MIQVTRTRPVAKGAAPVPTADGRDTAAVAQWLAAFAAAVRGRDYAAGRRLFDPAVVSFGTRASAVAGLDQLVAEQWRHVWDRTRGFDFDPHHDHLSVHGDTAWAAVHWHSQGVDADGHWFDRFGRATFVLRRGGTGDVGGGWLAVHSHFSLDPARSATALAAR